MAKKNQATAPIEDETTLDITIPVIQEDVPQESVQGFTSNALTLISVTEETLLAIENTYGGYKIEGDAKRYKEAKDVKNRLVKVRTSIEKRRIAINKAFQASINGEAERITGRTSKVEKHLVTELTEYEEAEQRRIAARREQVTTAMLDAGFSFNGVAFECGEQTIWQTDIDTITNETLDIICDAARTFRINEAAAQAETARRAAPVYLHQPELNELLTLTRGEFEIEADALRGNGVVEITKEEYDQIKEAKLAAFRRPTPAPAQTPEPPAAQAANPVRMNQGFLTPKPPAASPTYETRTPPTEPQEHEVGFAASFSTEKNPNNRSVEDIEFDNFNQGYEKFRSQVLAAFNDANIKYTRAQWIEFFTTLKYTKKV